MDKRYKNLLIIDGSYLLHRSLKVPDLWDLMSSRGERSGGIYGFLNSLSYLVRNYPDYYPVVAWDKGRSPRRLEIYPQYKGEHLLQAEIAAESNISEDEFVKSIPVSLNESIEDMRAAFSSIRSRQLIGSVESDNDDYVKVYVKQRRELQSILESLGVPSIMIKDWEGDDIITLLSRISKSSFIVTDDRDMIQLLSDDISVIRPLAKEVLEYKDYMLSEDLYSSRELVLIKAIVGDASDSIPSATDGLERKFRVGSVRAKKIAKILIENNEDYELSKDIILTNLKNPGIGFIDSYDKYIRNLKLVDLSLVPDDMDVYNHIHYTISERDSKRNLLTFVERVSKFDITTIDYQSIMNSISKSSPTIELD